jgi:hypothetical protein
MTDIAAQINDCTYVRSYVHVATYVALQGTGVPTSTCSSLARGLRASYVARGTITLARTSYLHVGSYRSTTVV